MSYIKDQTASGIKFHIERYETAQEVVDKCRSRPITSPSFHDMSKKYIKKSWHGVGSYNEALELMRTGYQPTVNNMKGILNKKLAGDCKRFKFNNNVNGFAPVVPLALKRVPNAMLDMSMKPIKAKVLDVYYDMTANCGVNPEDLIKAGETLLGSIIELEQQGYRFNLYAVQDYYEDKDGDLLVVKIKSSTQPLDLKRVSFPLTHPGFFRVIGFDWYSKVPGGKHRRGYGHAVAYDHDDEEMAQITKQLFGDNAIMFSAAKIIHESEDSIKNTIIHANCVR